MYKTIVIAAHFAHEIMQFEERLTYEIRGSTDKVKEGNDKKLVSRIYVEF